MNESKTLKQKVVSGLFWKFSERICAQVVSLLVTIVLARLLLPEDYGAVSLVTIFITIANVFVSDGFGVALIHKKDADNVDFSTIFFFGILFSAGVYLFLFFFAAPLSRYYNMPILVPVLRVLGLKIPIAAINSVQQAYVSREMIFKRFFFSTIIGTAVSAVVGIGMAYAGYGVWALVAQYLVNTIMDTVILWVTVKWRPEFVFSFKRLKALFSYGWKLFFQRLFVTVYANLRSLVIGKVYSSADLAYYNKGSQFPNLIVTNVDTAISSTLFPAMSKEQDSLERIKAIAKRATKLSSYIMCPLLVGFAACAEPFVVVVLTEKWLPIVPYLRIICLNLLCRPAQTATLQAIKATGRSDAVLKMDIPVRAFGIISLLIAVRYGVIYIAATELMVGILGLVIYASVCGSIVGYGLREVALDCGTNVVMSFFMGFVVYLIGLNTMMSPLLKLIIQIIVGMIVYVVMSFVTKSESFLYVINEIKHIKRKRLGNED